MKKAIKFCVTLSLIFLLCPNIFSQWLNPSPFGMVKTTAGFYTNSAKTWIAGDKGFIAYTPNLGVNWNTTFINGEFNFKNIFFVTPQKGFAVADAGKIVKTTDGFSWTYISTLSPANLYGLYFTDENTGYTGGGLGALFKTTNSGVNWQSISYSDKNIYQIQFLNASTGFIVDNISVMKTTNEGANWFSISDASIIGPPKIYFANENIGYLAASASIYKTTNGGINWVNKYTLSGNPSGLAFTDIQTGYVTEGSSVSKTTNGGETWTRKTLSAEYPMTGVTFLNDTIGLVYELDGKIFRTTNAGETWNPTAKYLTDAHVTDVKSYGTKKVWASIGNNYFFRTTNAGVKWDTIALGANSINSIAIADSSNLWSFGNAGLLGKSTNGGLNWSFQSNPFPNITYKGFFLNKSTGWFYGANGGVYKTTNAGNDWSDVSLNPDAAASKIQFLNAQTGWASSGSGFYRFYKTTNGGANWTGSFININGEYARSFHFINENTGFILGNSVLSKTTNGGINWTESSLGFTGAKDIFFYNHVIGYILGTGGKCYSTLNGGQNWYSQMNYNTVYDLNSFYVTSDYNIWFGGTFGAIIKYNIPPIDRVHQLSSIADKYFLSQNYPNPFNPSTQINYKIKSSGFVSLKVFDLLGKEVAVLINENQNSGSYAVDFNSTEFNLPSGIYFYTLKTDGFAETKKMVLVK